jgi:hypothetical protein
VKPKVLRLEGVTDEARHEMIGRVERAVSACGGSILDFRQFSNASVCLDFEIAASRLGRLRDALAATGLRLSAASLDALAAASASADAARESAAAARESAAGPGASAAAAELPCSLALIFFHDEPDLRIEVPAVPG